MSLESRKGTCVALGSARALMHIPSVVRDRLMLTASLARSPVQHTQVRLTPADCLLQYLVYCPGQLDANVNQSNEQQALRTDLVPRSGGS